MMVYPMISASQLALWALENQLVQMTKMQQYIALYRFHAQLEFLCNRILQASQAFAQFSSSDLE